ncbi:hypothetical protein EG329_000271 [Mollisiaceae sp. DMI_Dod_QoI]|nr:hypothetical protein EG329_000271 [Helotiales sp. DMI_Dod_QoI]
MDPLTALSVAGTIIQFVDFGNKLLTSSMQLYKSSQGSLKAYEELELVTGDLQSVVAKLRRASSIVPEQATPAATEEFHREKDVFLEICDQTANIAQELLDRLKTLKVKSNGYRALESLKAAVRTAWSKDEISSLKGRLSILKDSLQSRSMVSIQLKLDASITQSSNRFDSLDKETQQILAAATRSREEVSAPIIGAIAKMLNRVQTSNEDEHHKTRQIIANLRNTVRPDLPMDVITASIEMLSVDPQEEEVLRRKTSKNILDELSYPGMTNRYEDITQAHPETFDWIFSDTKKWKLPWSDFSEWLRRDGDIYWIRGKAGSGKSTLMKHIYDDKRTRALLQRWVGSSTSSSAPYCIATFFFWNSGTQLQQSQRGLLRALLFQVLEEYPALTPIVFPGLWTEIYSEILGGIPKSRQWSIKQLYDAFEKLIRQKQHPLKLCFFVDGLDEFSGDIEQLCILFNRLGGASDDVKFCLSSRPWVVFQEALENCPGLRLQDLTSKDIETYVNSKFKESPAFFKLAARDEQLASSLANEISERAEGVFLWVRIVVEHILRGVNNRDGIPQLWRRLRSFPRELYPLYDSILSQIEPIYLEWASRAFQILKVSTELSSDPFKKRSKPSWQKDVFEKDLLLSAEEEGVQQLTLMEFLFAFTEDANLIDRKQLPRIFEDLKIHLTARCAGLVEVSNCKKHCCVNAKHCREQVRWMHRTAHDFINEDAKWTKILNDNSPQDYSPHFTLMRSSVMALSMHLWPETNELEVEEENKFWATNVWIYAYHANGHAVTRQERTALLKRLSNMEASGSNLGCSQPDGWGTLSWAAMYCLSDFVEDVLSTETGTTQCQTANELLRCLWTNLPVGSRTFPFATNKMVNSLLTIGKSIPRLVDPCPWDDYDSYMPAVAMTRVLNLHPLEISRFLESTISVFEAFVKADQDPTNSLAFVPRDFIFRKKVLQEKVEKKLQHDSDNITRILGMLADAMKEEIRIQQSCRRQCIKKRKLFEVLPDGIISILDGSDDDGSDDDDVVFLSEGPVESAKRIKFKEDG